MGGGTEIHKSIVQTGLGETFLVRTIIVGIILEVTVCIVVVTIAATEDIVNTALDILHIGSGIGDVSIRRTGGVMNLVLYCSVDTFGIILGSKDASA